jgi:hypothetical protein
MVIEDVRDSQDLKWQSNQENVIRRVAPLDDMEPVAQIDPPGVYKLPKQCAAVFEQIAEETFPSFGIGCRYMRIPSSTSWFLL